MTSFSFHDLDTPCYIFHEDILCNNFDNLSESFHSYWPNVKIGYSYKTNALPFLINWFKRNGCYAEVVSSDEYELARWLGYENSEIIINGPCKGYDNIRAILDDGGIVNIDNESELNWIVSNCSGKSWKVGVRFNFDLESYCPDETLMGSEPGRFGLNFENGSLERAIIRIKESKGLSLIGLHSHNSTKTKSLNVFRAVSRMCVIISKKYALKLDYVDIGGGMFGDKPGAPTYGEYAEVITKELRGYFSSDNTTLIIEPGAALVASCFSYLTKIVDVKKVQEYSIATSDGSLMQIDPQMSGRPFNYKVYPKNKTTSAPSKTVVTGYTCMEKDRLIYSDSIALSIDDKIQFMNAGAYTLSFSPLFIKYLPPVYVESDNQYSVVRERWTVAEYVRKSKVEL